LFEKGMIDTKHSEEVKVIAGSEAGEIRCLSVFEDKMKSRELKEFCF